MPDVMNALKKYKNCKFEDIDWEKYFDAIWCTNYSKYSERRETVKRELDSVGITRHKNFFWNITTQSIFENIVNDVSKNLKRNGCEKPSVLNLSLGHYHAIKSSYDMGFERILVLEDDVSFLKDGRILEDYLESIPKDADIVLFSQNMCDEGSLENYLKSSGKTDKYIKYDFTIYDSSCYMLSRKAMSAIIKSYENYLRPSDHYLSPTYANCELVHYYSSKPLSIQIESMESISGLHNGVYVSMGLDVGDYGLDYPLYRGAKNIKFRIVIPMYNSEETIGRCIDSIKRQSYSNFEVVVVDDSSTDGSVNVAKRMIDGDSRFSIITLKGGNKGGGNARNVGLDCGIDSDYTLFIDSDDEYFSHDALGCVANRLFSTNYVDYLLCPFVEGDTFKIEWLRYSSISDYITKSCYNAPWIACVKSELVRKFEGNVSAYDDFLQHFRQIDSIRNFSYCTDIILKYNHDGNNSFWNKERDEKKEFERKRCLLNTFDAATKERFQNPLIQKEVNERFIDSVRYEVDKIRCSSDFYGFVPTNGEELSSYYDFYRNENVLFTTNGVVGCNSILEKSIMTYSFVAHNRYIVDYATSKKCGNDAFLDIFSYAVENGYKYAIYVDADCFIVNHENLLNEFKSFVKSGSAFSGVSDGGMLCHRNNNRFAINPFLMFVNVGRIEKCYKGNGSFDFGKFDNFDSSKVDGKTLKSWKSTFDEYCDFRKSIKNFSIPHAKLIGSDNSGNKEIHEHYGSNMTPWTFDDSNITAEKYYGIFLPFVMNSDNPIKFMYATDYPLECDRSGITSAIYASNPKTKRIIDNDNIICVHSWFSRFYNDMSSQFSRYHHSRINSIAEYANNSLNSKYHICSK